MNYKILLLGTFAAILTGCSSAYRTMQTPDDVYYSPERPVHYAAREDRYEEYVGSQEDQYLRMKIRDRQRWAMIDDYNYWNDMRYMPSYSYNYYRNNWHNPYYWNTWDPYYRPFFNSYYNPYYDMGYGYHGFYPTFGYRPYSNVIISKYPTRAPNNVFRPNLNSYNNRSYNNRNYQLQERYNNASRGTYVPNNRSYNNRNSNNYNSNNEYRAPERTYSPSSSGGSSSGGSSGRSGGVSRPPRN